MTVKAIGEVQLDFHVHQTIPSQVLMCVLVNFHADTHGTLQGTMFEPLGAHGPPEPFISPSSSRECHDIASQTTTDPPRAFQKNQAAHIQ